MPVVQALVVATFLGGVVYAVDGDPVSALYTAFASGFVCLVAIMVWRELDDG